MKIYTKTGDKGNTSLFDNIRVSKDDIRVESYGTVDELGSWLGLAKNYVKDEKMFTEIQNIQNKLFTLAANLATEDQSKVKFHIKEADIESLENITDYYIDKIGSIEGFIVPGSGKSSGYLHVGRTICRRAERRMISLSKIAGIDPLVMKYINRLSDAIYSMARYAEKTENEVQYE